MANRRKTTEPEMMENTGSPVHTEEEPAAETKEEPAAAEENRKAGRKKNKVRIQIPHDYKHKDDMTVGLNGTLYRLQRGKTVEVDEDVAEIIMRSLEQDVRTDEMIRNLVETTETEK